MPLRRVRLLPHPTGTVMIVTNQGQLERVQAQSAAYPGYQASQCPLPGETDAPNNGFLNGARLPTSLEPGMLLPRFGRTSSNSEFVTAVGTPAPMLSLPPSNDGLYAEYIVERPILADAGPVAPCYGQPGLGWQYVLDQPIETLISNGDLAVPGTPSSLTGTWTGTYVCLQGLTDLELQIGGVENISSPTETLQATFTFQVPGTPLKGSFSMSGNYTADSQLLNLAPSGAENLPPGYVTVGLTGRLTGNTISGNVDGPGCSSFSVGRS